MNSQNDKEEGRQQTGQAEESGFDRPDASYPPETHGLMSWSSLRFIHRPTLRPLAWVAYGILGTIGVGLVATVFIRQDAVVGAVGEIVPDPGVLEVVAATDGLMGTPRVEVGQTVDKDEVLALLQMDIDEAQLEDLLVALERNVALFEAADFRTGLPAQLIDTQDLNTLGDDAVREAAAALEATVGRRIGLAEAAQFESLRDRAIEATYLLRSALVGYMERHILRAPAEGTLLQYAVSMNQNVGSGEVVATVLPEGARLVARLILEPRDLPDIAAGQMTRHQLDAYPYQRYGVFEGEVISIEQSVQTDGVLTYEVLTTVQNSDTLSPELASTVRLVMGMGTASEIITGRSTLYELARDSFFN